ncbi:hypothetical protein [Ekhidna sp.]|uniref:hypothetical protein n=1 Tax=Ekhidna sp. TaxID=2608089 RepID=UPI00329A7C5C
MMLRNKFLAVLLLPFFAFSQSPEEDEVKLKSALEWLDSKLNYIYYDDAGEQWWTNTFYVNDSYEITIKHIASDRPNTGYIKEKTYTIRRFQIQDINPNSLKITEIKESRGRIVKGQMLELRTYGFQDLIHKAINKRKASSTSFLFLSFPETLIDSLSNYAEIVKSKFEEAISASSQTYAAGDAADVKTVLSTLTGSFRSSDGSKWIAESVQPNVLKIERGNDTIEYFGYDMNEKKFYLLTITDQGLNKKQFILEEALKLKLSTEKKIDVIQIETPHSFTINGRTFFRQ